MQRDSKEPALTFDVGGKALGGLHLGKDRFIANLRLNQPSTEGRERVKGHSYLTEVCYLHHSHFGKHNGPDVVAREINLPIALLLSRA